MEPVSIREIAAVTGGELLGEGGVVTSVAIDSRRVTRGTLFCALPGEKADGHDFVGAAFDAGAACCLVTHAPMGVSGPMVVVPDVESAIKALAEWYRGKFDIPVIGIVGTVGKTTAKEMIWAVLSQHMNVLKTEGNLNNQIGVPMTVSRISSAHQAAVIEMGISGFGEMSVLAAMARPAIAVFTKIGHAHLEFLHDLDGVFAAKTEMIKFMPDGGTVIINGDDEKLRELRCRQNIVSFGLGADCAVRAENVRFDGENGISCDIVYGSRRIPVRIPAYGQHMVYAALEGASAGFVMGLSDAEIAAGIAAYHTVGRRGVVVNTGYITLIDDCYNANPDSMQCAIDSLVKLPGRHVCVLADMREMGEDSPEMHRELGHYALEKGVDFVAAYGPMSRCLTAAMGDKARHFDTKAELIAALPALVERGDNVLVKASLGMHLEDAAEALKKLGTVE